MCTFPLVIKYNNDVDLSFSRTTILIGWRWGFGLWSVCRRTWRTWILSCRWWTAKRIPERGWDVRKQWKAEVTCWPWIPWIAAVWEPVLASNLRPDLLLKASTNVVLQLRVDNIHSSSYSTNLASKLRLDLLHRLGPT